MGVGQRRGVTRRCNQSVGCIGEVQKGDRRSAIYSPGGGGDQGPQPNKLAQKQRSNSAAAAKQMLPLAWLPPPLANGGSAVEQPARRGSGGARIKETQAGARPSRHTSLTAAASAVSSSRPGGAAAYKLATCRRSLPACPSASMGRPAWAATMRCSRCSSASCCFHSRTKS